MNLCHIDVNPAGLRGKDVTERGALPCMLVDEFLIHKQMLGRMIVYAKHDCMQTEDLNMGKLHTIHMGVEST